MKFSIEMDTLNNAIREYDEALTNMRTNLVQLQKGLEAIRNGGWKGKSKEEFMAISYGDWEKGISQHISRMEFLQGLLKEGRGKFEEFVDEGERLRV